jgi:hypothetical protein
LSIIGSDEGDVFDHSEHNLKILKFIEIYSLLDKSFPSPFLNRHLALCQLLFPQSTSAEALPLETLPSVRF